MQAEQPFADRISVADFGAGTAWLLPTPVQDVVTLKGSFYTLPHFEQGEEVVQEVTTALLDKGTIYRDRFEVAEALENRGAQLSFYADGLRVGFWGRALKEDVPLVLDLLAEQLRAPALDAAEFEKARQRAIAGVRRAMESASAQARGAMARRLFPEAHPNYAPEPQHLLEKLSALTVEDVRRFHAEHVGAKGLLATFAGDLDETVIVHALRDKLGDWAAHTSPLTFDAEARPLEPGRSAVHMQDRVNVEVRLGHTLPIRRDDPDYLALYLANYVLGGNFSARLMAHVRDERGLTYGIGSTIADAATEHDAHWSIYVTLSSPVVEEGIAATREVVTQFVEGGVTEAELADKKTTITGSYSVGLASTGGLVETMLRAAENGFSPAYLDTFPEEINALHQPQVNELVRRYFHPDQLHEALAGTLVLA